MLPLQASGLEHDHDDEAVWLTRVGVTETGDCLGILKAAAPSE